MNKFELYTIMYYAIDAYYDNKKNIDEKIVCFISDINPFIWVDCISADPAYFEEFKKFIGKKQITKENSFDLVKKYIKTIDYVDVFEVFEKMSEEKWKKCCEAFLSMEHKGENYLD